MMRDGPPPFGRLLLLALFLPTLGAIALLVPLRAGQRVVRRAGPCMKAPPVPTEARRIADSLGVCPGARLFLADGRALVWTGRDPVLQTPPGWTPRP
ncbi:MAG: hypothetical protein NW201_10680 [Gemmatimonadales bacterium]|nr:hypothetical protein [Gemmatimonadales bacterium]